MLSTKKRKALEALLTTKNRMEAAKVSGCAADTLRRYLLEDEFRREFEKRQREVLDEAVDGAKRSLSVSLDTLKGILDNDDAAPSVRVSAARTLLEFGIRLIETQELAQKIERLEQYMNEQSVEKRR